MKDQKSTYEDLCDDRNIHLKYFLLLLISICFLFVPALICHAETIYLKNGKRIEGKITDRNSDSVKVEVNSFKVTFYSDEIEKIEGGVESISVKEIAPNIKTASIPLTEEMAQPTLDVNPIVSAVPGISKRNSTSKVTSKAYDALTKSIQTVGNNNPEDLKLLKAIKDLADSDSKEIIWSALDKAFAQIDIGRDLQAGMFFVRRGDTIRMINDEFELILKKGLISDKQMIDLLQLELKHPDIYCVMSAIEFIKGNHSLLGNEAPYLLKEVFENINSYESQGYQLEAALLNAIKAIGPPAKVLSPQVIQLGRFHPTLLSDDAEEVLQAIGGKKLAWQLQAHYNLTAFIFAVLQLMLAGTWVFACRRYGLQNKTFVIGRFLTLFYKLYAAKFIIMGSLSIFSIFLGIVIPMEGYAMVRMFWNSIVALLLVIWANREILIGRDDHDQRVEQDTNPEPKLYRAGLMPAIPIVLIVGILYAKAIIAGSEQVGEDWSGFAIFTLTFEALPVIYWIFLWNLQYLSGKSKSFEGFVWKCTIPGIIAAVFLWLMFATPLSQFIYPIWKTLFKLPWSDF